MPAISQERSSFAQTAVISLVTFAALALLALVLAYWTWEWLAPHPEPRAQEAVQSGGLAAPGGTLMEGNKMAACRPGSQSSCSVSSRLPGAGRHMRWYELTQS